MKFNLLNRNVTISNQILEYYASELSEMRFIRHIEHFYGCVEAEAREMIELMEQDDLDKLIEGRINAENMMARKTKKNEFIQYIRLDGSEEKKYF